MITPPWPYRLAAYGSPDGVLRHRDGVLERLLHVDGEPVVVRAAQPAADRVVVGAWADRADLAEEGVARMRFAIAVDDDLRAFHDRFRHDPLIGPAVRMHPTLRIRRRAQPFEALAWAVTEQLIDTGRAFAIQRRMVRALGRRCATTGLWDAPDAAAVAGAAPALLESFDLTPSRAIALRRVALEVARGRVDLDAPGHEAGWRRLRAVRGIGPWTVECLALFGQGRHDQLPAGDLGYRKLVARIQPTHPAGHPLARVSEEEVRAFFAPYEGWAGLAGAYALRGPLGAGWPGGESGVRSPGRAGTRSSATAPPVAA